MSGNAERPRLSVFISNKQVYAQIINDAEGNTIVASSTLTKELREAVAGKTTTEKAKLIGAEIAKRAVEAGVKAVVFDKSGYKYGKRLSALADAAREGGLAF